MTTDNKNIERIEKQAYEWLSIMHSDCKTSEEVKQFQLWLEADTQHKVIYDDIYSLWFELPDLQGVTDPRSYQDLSDPGFWKKFISFELDRPALAGIAGCAGLLVIALVLFMNPASRTTQGDNNYFTQTAEIKEFQLPDTSMVTLGALSTIAVEYSAMERRVELISGEAFFSVERDVDRPFFVTAADTEIRVLGTIFDVRRSRTGVRVSVLEGKVEVVQTRKEDDHGSETRISTKRVLRAQERIRTESDGGLSDIQPVRQSRPGAWREGRLIYEDAKLSEVISDANRYYYGNITIDTEDLKGLALSASFRTDQIQEMMDTLSIVLPISTMELPNGDIAIRRSGNPDG